MKALIVCLIAALAVSASAEPVVDISKIAGKSPGEVEKALGSSSGQEITKHGPKKIYKAGKVEVVFINGKADWITVSELSAVPFDAKAIESLGLKAAAPTSQSDFVIKWEPLDSYKSVSIYNAKGKVDYAYIKALTR